MKIIRFPGGVWLGSRTLGRAEGESDIPALSVQHELGKIQPIFVGLKSFLEVVNHQVNSIRLETNDIRRYISQIYRSEEGP